MRLDASIRFPETAMPKCVWAFGPGTLHAAPGADGAANGARSRIRAHSLNRASDRLPADEPFLKFCYEAGARCRPTVAFPTNSAGLPDLTARPSGNGHFWQ